MVHFIRITVLEDSRYGRMIIIFQNSNRWLPATLVIQNSWSSLLCFRIPQPHSLEGVENLVKQQSFLPRSSLSQESTFWSPVRHAISCQMQWIIVQEAIQTIKTIYQQHEDGLMKLINEVKLQTKNNLEYVCSKHSSQKKNKHGLKIEIIIYVDRQKSQKFNPNRFTMLNSVSLMIVCFFNMWEFQLVAIPVFDKTSKKPRELDWENT